MKKLIYCALLTLFLAPLATPLAALPNQPKGATNRLLVIAPGAFHPALQAFIRESNRGDRVWFLDHAEDLGMKLQGPTKLP